MCIDSKFSAASVVQEQGIASRLRGTTAVNRRPFQAPVSADLGCRLSTDDHSGSRSRSVQADGPQDQPINYIKRITRVAASAPEAVLSRIKDEREKAAPPPQVKRRRNDRTTPASLTFEDGSVPEGRAAGANASAGISPDRSKAFHPLESPRQPSLRASPRPWSFPNPCGPLRCP